MQTNSPYAYLFDKPQALIERVIDNVERVILGKREAIEAAVIAFLCNGHVLLEDVPGVGKTMLVKALAKTIGCSFKRIQFTPDLLPSDVTGVSIFNQKTNDFEFRPGPVMANIVLADELNRTSPKTQSALLEAMEEKHVTVDGVTYPLPEPFLILATQNPLEFNGTYSLPEAQLDRFMIRISLGYPGREQEVQMLDRLQLRHPINDLKPVLLKEELVALQKEIRAVYVDETLKQYIVCLAEATRNHPDLEVGASPRASIALMRASQAKAWIQGRTYVIPDDMKDMVLYTFCHRIQLKMEAASAGKTCAAIMTNIVRNTQVPHVRTDSGYTAGFSLNRRSAR